jgi:hypothetical protein
MCNGIVHGQNDCDQLEITICFLPDAIYCQANPNSNGCGYTLDGRLMDDALARKLNNTNNFGEFGVVECPIQLLPLTEDVTVDYIEQSSCDIIFTGNFIIDTLTGGITGDVTSIPNNILNQIRDWSLKSTRNLVITTQAEAAVWGYDIQNGNENPNISNGNQLGEAIFNGPFGNVPSFSQGGTYQGVIREGPTTGFEVLGIDDNKLPTFVLDNATNDIIIGDIGVFCGNFAGQVSDGPNINNNNDRLVANIFALGCSIVNSTNTTTNVDLCPNDVYILPGGDNVMTPGVYVDTLLTIDLCDSIVTTVISPLANSVIDIFHDGCEDDSFSTIINGNIYDEDNTTGQEIIPSANGCDSIINIDLFFKPNSAFILNETICANDSIVVGGEVFNTDKRIGQVTLTSANDCDSIVDIELSITELEQRSDSFILCPNESVFINGIPYSEPVIDTIVLDAQIGCDTMYIFEIDVVTPISTDNIPSSLEIDITEDINLEISIESNSSILWTPESLVSCNTCTEITISPDIELSSLYYTITDENGCFVSDSIQIEYTCPLYVPNIFSKSATAAVNQEFALGSPCLGSITEFNMRIYDRWGNLAFESFSTDELWQGFFDNEESLQGVYVYQIQYSINGFISNETGHITLIK